jgi:hypothetical protein
MACNSMFTLVVKKHHCVACGKVYCGKCSKVRAHSEHGVLLRQRFCVVCEEQCASRSIIMRGNQKVLLRQRTSPPKRQNSATPPVVALDGSNPMQRRKSGTCSCSVHIQQPISATAILCTIKPRKKTRKDPPVLVEVRSSATAVLPENESMDGLSSRSMSPDPRACLTPPTAIALEMVHNSTCTFTDNTFLNRTADSAAESNVHIPLTYNDGTPREAVLREDDLETDVDDAQEAPAVEADCKTVVRTPAKSEPASGRELLVEDKTVYYCSTSGEGSARLRTGAQESPRSKSVYRLLPTIAALLVVCLVAAGNRHVAHYLCSAGVNTLCYDVGNSGSFRDGGDTWWNGPHGRTASRRGYYSLLSPSYLSYLRTAAAQRGDAGGTHARVVSGCADSGVPNGCWAECEGYAHLDSAEHLAAGMPARITRMAVLLPNTCSQEGAARSAVVRRTSAVGGDTAFGASSVTQGFSQWGSFQLLQTWSRLAGLLPVGWPSQEDYIGTYPPTGVKLGSEGISGVGPPPAVAVNIVFVMERPPPLVRLSNFLQRVKQELWQPLQEGVEDADQVYL